MADRSQAEERRRCFGEVLAQLLSSRGMTQHDLATALEASGHSIGGNQSTVSAWVNGKAEPSADTVFAVESVLELSPGYLSRHLGYLPVENGPPVSTVEEAVIASTEVSEDLKAMLLGVYREFRRKTEQMRQVEEGRKDRRRPS